MWNVADDIFHIQGGCWGQTIIHTKGAAAIIWNRKWGQISYIADDVGTKGLIYLISYFSDDLNANWFI